MRTVGVRFGCAEGHEVSAGLGDLLVPRYEARGRSVLRAKSFLWLAARWDMVVVVGATTTSN